jgi:aminoglycoside 6'-N-acetyltransferase I
MVIIMHVRLIEMEDTQEWLRMRRSLWPECSQETHIREMEAIRCNLSDTPVFVACRDTGGLCGFLEAALHLPMGGCEPIPVGYIEAWYVDSDVRQTGIGRLLAELAEAWAMLRGCQEMESDCLIDNATSAAAHLALGYVEAERLIHFRKSLVSAAARKSK